MPFMPFGKHQGKPLSEVPSSYLRWLLRECDLEPWLRAAAQRRGPAARPPEPADAEKRLPARLNDVLRQWRREMVRKYHPDRGGSVEAMAAINDAHDRLRELVGG